MKLSIIIPVYKVEAYLDECLNSVMENEDLGLDYEVILVNDGSPDNSMAIALRYASFFSNIRIIEQENQGLSVARMNGLAIAKGEYVWFVDSDDYLCKGAVGKVISYLNERRDIDVLLFPLMWVYGTEQKDNQDFLLKQEVVEMSGKDVLRFEVAPLWAAQRFVINKHLFESPKLFFPKNLLHEDEYFGRVLLYEANKISLVAKPVYNYRQREGSITRHSQIRSSYDLVDIYKLLSSYSKIEVTSDDQTWFNSQLAILLLQSYLKNKSLFGTDEFRDFHCKHANYIMEEYNKNAREICLGDRLSAYLLLHNPSLYAFLAKVVHWKYKCI